MSFASIMIVTFNRLSLTKQTLDNLFQTTTYPFNLIFVDNGSKDGTIQYIKDFCDMQKSEYYLGYKIQSNENNLGIAVGRNQALQIADGNWLVTLDNDVLLPNNWLNEAIDVITKNPRFGMIGVNMENISYPIITSNKKEFQRKPQGNLGTACIVFNRSFHKMLGFFNTEMGLYAHEDADMGMRARVVGYELGYIKENGKHLGEGDNDIGEYRQFKTESHKANLTKFNENCRAYISGKKPIYISFKS